MHFTMRLLSLVWWMPLIFSLQFTKANSLWQDDNSTAFQNTCFEASLTPGCSDSLCEEYICEEVDAFCCNKEWDEKCVAAATEHASSVCLEDWPDQANDCFEADPFGRPRCDPGLCETTVCILRPECCEDSYDEACVGLALKHCELPPPENSCIEESRLPGCLESVCLESVCELDKTCCTQAYTPQCVELARTNPTDCSPRKASNTCYQESPYGGCSDKRCQAVVCDFADRCCDASDAMGKWDQNCVTAAESLCQPIILDLPNNNDCPPGMFCSYDDMANCTQLVDQYHDVLYLGNILGGIYCGENRSNANGIQNCPRGSYCPTPEEKIPCPEGYYCPYKTQEPSIRCTRCQEGALELQLDMYGFIALSIIAVMVVVYIGWGLLQRYNKNLAAHIGELEKRVLHRKAAAKKLRTEKDRDLEKLRPKLELIGYRLAKLESGGQISPKNSSPSHGHIHVSGIDLDEDSIKVDATRLFDVLDADASGDLTFDELNVILGLSEVELKEFIRRMNEMADAGSSQGSVTRPVFAKYFLQVLTDTSNLTISYEEAEAIFDELLAMNNNTTNNNGNVNRETTMIHMNNFYASSMSEFLSDFQILDLIKEFKALKADLAVAEGAPQPEPEAMGRRMSLTMNRRASMRMSSIGSASDLNTTSVTKQSANGSGRRNSTVSQLPSTQNTGRSAMWINREFFVDNYPQLLMDVILKEDDHNDDRTELMDFRGVDLSFQDLSLSVKLGKEKMPVVNHVTGRIRGKTMTALMGGSGAGKTSLLNALCGRAHYGETSGKIYLNGHETDIESHVDCIGFVPQDDIVYAELTVRENFIFAGRFRLPKGTTDEEIEELADETIANLGLARVANSPVGDVKRRGVSGGEKKRVNIGIELMGLPSILFLDEPTSGLDASSALLVMKSLNHLVQKDGVTVVSVIHQPRKFIYDLFDSLILLGVGGQVIYHGSTEGAESYFGRLNYKLPKGESVADWLIDISSGRLEPENTVSLNKEESMSAMGRSINRTRSNDAYSVTMGKVNEEKKDEDDDASGERLDHQKIKESLSGIEVLSMDSDVGTRGIDTATRVITDDNCVGKKGVTTGKVVRALEDAKVRRAWLCKEWQRYFQHLDGVQKSLYEPPEKYELPLSTVRPTFWNQFVNQVKRALIVSWRDRLAKTISSTIIVGSVIFITALDGVTGVSIDRDSNLPFSVLVRPQESDLPGIFNELFAYSLSGQMQYPMKVGIILCIIVGLTATTTVTSKRMEFFREAGSGYDLNAYFFAVNILSTIEHSIQVLIAALFATWIRHPIASYVSYYIHFLLLTWLTVAWSMLLPMVCPADSVTLVAGFFFAFFGLVFSGAFSPFGYKEIYEEAGLKEFLAGWLSPTRFFFEALAVGEYRCMPEQSGFTIETTSLNRESNSTMMSLLGYAGHDKNAVRKSCNGWYWSVLPVLCVGFTVRYLAIGAMHACFRAQQAKKPLLYVMKRDFKLAVMVASYLCGFILLFSLTTWLFVRDEAFEENIPLTQVQLLNEYGFFD